MKPERVAMFTGNLSLFFRLKIFAEVLLILLLPHFSAVVAAQSVNDSSRFPHPQGENLLFFLQRTKDANTVVYEANYKNDGTLDNNIPVKSSWIRYTEQGRRKDLTAI